MKAHNQEKEQSAILALIEQEHKNYKQEALGEVLRLVDAEASDEAIKNSISGIRSRYLSLLSKVKFKLSGTVQAVWNGIEQEESNKTIQKNNKTITRLCDELRIHEAEKREIKLTYDWSQYWWRVLAEVIIFGGELSFNALAFTSMGGSILLSALPASVIAIGLAFSSYFIPRTVKNRTTTSGRIGTTIALGGFIVAILIVIGILRSTAVFGGGMLSNLTDGNVELGVIIFTLLNSFMFFTGMILSWGLPSKEDRLMKDGWDKLAKAIKKVRNEIQRVEDENRKLQGNSSASKSQRAHTTSVENHFATLIENYKEETIAAFLSELACKKPFSNTHQYFSNNKTKNETI